MHARFEESEPCTALAVQIEDTLFIVLVVGTKFYAGL
jgi:hypothetical protein